MIKTLERINLLRSPLLMYLIENNNLLSIKQTKKIETTKRVLAIMVDEGKFNAKNFSIKSIISIIR